MQVLQQPHLKVEIAEGFTNLYGEQRFYIKFLTYISPQRKAAGGKTLCFSTAP